jgi:hypothetical protein
MQCFSNNPEAMGDALIISELGAGVPLFLLAIPFAMYFGKEHADKRDMLASVAEFFRSPMFIALVLGIAFSFLRLPQDNIVVKTIYSLLGIIGGSIEIFTAFAVGLMLQKIPFRRMLPPIAALFIINLIAEPLIALGGAHLFGLSQLEDQVLVLEAGPDLSPRQAFGWEPWNSLRRIANLSLNIAGAGIEVCEEDVVPDHLGGFTHRHPVLNLVGAVYARLHGP